MIHVHCIPNTYAVIMFQVAATCSVHLDYITRKGHVIQSSPLSPILCADYFEYLLLYRIKP